MTGAEPAFAPQDLPATKDRAGRFNVVALHYAGINYEQEACA